MATADLGRTSVGDLAAIDGYRTLALLGLAVATSATLTILYEITVILGGSTQLLLRVAVAVGGAWLAARALRPTLALAIFAGLALLGYAWYLVTATADPLLAIRAPWLLLVNTVNDTLRIVTGMSVLTIQATDVWALSFAPAPIFLTWYLGFRRRYAAAAGLAGATMSLFVLAGDLDVWWTLVGATGIIAVVGFGELERHAAPARYAELLVVVFAAVAVVAVAVPLVPGGGVVGPLNLVGGDDIAAPNASSIQSSVIDADEELDIVGEIELSPEVRYTIESEEPVYWRTGVYDRYTGDGWVRTGSQSSFSRPQRVPVSNTTLVEQRVRAEVRTELLPAAGEPVDVNGIDDVLQTEQGAIVAGDPLEPGTTYAVWSAVPNREALDEPTGYSQSVRSRYTQLPEDVPDRVHELTDQLLAGVDGPLAQAARVENYLKAQKNYSLDVSRPSGDIADTFLFEMEAGYCTYFATTMVTMLRSADVPARFAVGYANGQQVAEDRWVVRGLNSHAWVEVYHPVAGWVPFDPTPPARETTRAERVEEARESDHPAVDTEESDGLPYGYDPSPGSTGPGATPGPAEPPRTSTPPGTGGIEPPGGNFNQSIIGPGQFNELPQTDADSGQGLTRPVAWERLGLALLITSGLVTGAYRLRPRRRLARQVARRWQRPTGEPLRDVERARSRVEWALSGRFRPRKPAETPRQYHRLLSVLYDDPALDRFFEVSEQVRYAGRREPELAAEAVGLADRIVADNVRIGGWPSWAGRGSRPSGAR